MRRVVRPVLIALAALGFLASGAPPAAAVPGPNLPYSWIREIGGGEVSVSGVAALPGGGVVVVGTGRWYQGFARAYEANGSPRWTYTWPLSTTRGNGDPLVYGDRVQGVAVDPSGNVYVAGKTDVPMPGITSLVGAEDGFLLKLDSTGQRVWTRQIGQASHLSRIFDVAVDRTGAVFVTGTTTAPLAALNAAPAAPNGFRTFAAGYRADGTRSWLRWLEGDGFGASVAVDAGGRVFVAGSAQRPADANGVVFLTVNGYVRLFTTAGLPVPTGPSVQLINSSTGGVRVYDVAVDNSGRATVVGYAAGQVTGADAGQKGGFALGFSPAFSRDGTTQLTDETRFLSVAIDGRGRRSALGKYDPDVVPSGLGGGDLLRLSLPAPEGSGSTTTKPIGTTFDEYPEAMANAFSRSDGALYEGASGRGPYESSLSSVSFRGFVGSSAGSAASPWYPYANPLGAVADLYTRFTGANPSTPVAQSVGRSLVYGSATPGTIIDDLRRSSDNVTRVDPVARLFRAYFLRSPDLGGFDYWVGRLRAGAPLSQVSSSFAASSEFTNRYGALSNRAFVELVYRNIFDREGDAGGVTYWTTQLNQGKKTRGQVMTNFSESTEGIRVMKVAVDVDVIYLQLLDRKPASYEFETWNDYVLNTPTSLLAGYVYQDVKQWN